MIDDRDLVNPTQGPCDPDDPNDSRNDNGFEERWALLTLSKADVSYLAVGTNHPHTNVDVYISTFNDPNLYGASVLIFAKTLDAGQWLAFTGNLTAVPADAAQTQHFTASAACDGFDVYLVTATPSTAGFRQVQVTAIAYGWEGSCCTGGGGGGGGGPDTVIIDDDTGGTVPSSATGGSVTVGFENYTAGHAWLLPATPVVGQRVTFVDLDGSLTRWAMTIDGNGFNVNGLASFPIGAGPIGSGVAVAPGGGVGPKGSIAVRFMSSTLGWKVVDA